MKLAHFCFLSLVAAWTTAFAEEIDLLTTLAPKYLAGSSAINEIKILTNGKVIVQSPKTTALWDIEMGEVQLGDINATYPIIEDYHPETDQALVYMAHDTDLALYDLASNSIIRTYNFDAPEREIRLGGQPPIEFETNPDSAIINFSSNIIRLDLTSGELSQLSVNENGQPYPDRIERKVFPKQGKYLESRYRFDNLFFEDLASVELLSIDTNEVLASVDIDPGQYIRYISGSVEVTETFGALYSHNEGAILYDLDRNTLSVLPASPSSAYLSLDISYDGQRNGLFIEDELWIIDSLNQAITARFPLLMETNGFSGNPTSFAFSPSSDSFFVGDDLGVIREWRLNPVDFVKEIGRHSGGASSTALEISPNGIYLASISSEGDTLILRPDTTIPPFSIETDASIRAAHFSDDSEMIALVDRGYRISTYDCSNGSAISAFPDTHGAVSFIAHLDDPNVAIIIYETGQSIQADPNTGDLLADLPRLSEHEEIHDIAKRSGWVVVETAENEIQVVDIFSNTLRWSTSEYTDRNVKARISDNGRYLLLYFRYFDESLAKVVDLETNTDRFLREGIEILDFTHAALSPDGRWLALGRNRSTDLYDLEDLSSVTVRHNSRPASLFSQNGDVYYTVDMRGRDFEIDSFDTRTGSQIHDMSVDLPTSFQFHLSDSYTIDLLNDGRLAAYSRGSLILANLTTNTAILTLPEIIPLVTSSNSGSVSISQDGTTIFSDNRDGIAQSWRIVDGTPYPCRIVPEVELFTIRFEPRPNAFYQLQTSTLFTNWSVEFNQAQIIGSTKSLRPTSQPYSPQFWRIVEFNTEN